MPYYELIHRLPVVPTLSLALTLFSLFHKCTPEDLIRSVCVHKHAAVVSASGVFWRYLRRFERVVGTWSELLAV